MSSGKRSNDDFINRINRLLDKKSDKELPSDDHLASRFKEVFDTSPLVTEPKKPNYKIPTSDADNEVEQYLLEAELLHAGDGDDGDDDDDDYLADILKSSHDKATTETVGKSQHQHGAALKAWQDTFMGGDDTILDDQGQALLDQLKDQAAVESKYASFERQRDDALEQRYLTLKEEGTALLKDDVSPGVTTNNPSTLPFGRIPQPLAMTDLHDEMDDWCCVCNEDATMECEDCDHDRFCQQCFYEGHQSDTADYGFSKHRAKKYIK